MAKSIVEPATEVVLDLTEKTPIQVLHVDDEPGLLKAAKQILEMQGLFQVETASSVEEALERMKRKAFDVIVSDYVMPGRDGLQFLRRLREEDNNIPFIIFTGKGREEVAIKALNLGADQYLNKGGSPETVYGELAHGIRKVVERKRAQEMLKESEERHRTLLDMANILIQSVSAEGRFVYVNKEWKKILGYTEKDLQKITMMDVIRKDQHKHCMDVFRQVMEGKSVRDVGTVFVAKDGREIMVSGNAMPRFQDGKFASTVGFFADITERKKAENALLESEELFRSIVENSHDGIVMIDDKFTITYANDEASHIIGYSKNEIIGQSFMKFLAEESKVLVQDRYLRRQRGESVPSIYEFEVVHKDGQRRNVEIKSTVLRDSKGRVQTVAQMLDITEQKSVEEKLRSIFASSPDAITVIDLSGNITECNQATLDMLGYSSKNELIGKNGLALVTEKDRGKVQENLKKLLELGSIKNSEYAALTKDGREFLADLSSSVIRDSSGNPIGFVGITKDITERKKIEEALRESEERHRELTESISDVFFAMDENLRYIYWNKASEKLTGISAENAIGKPLSEIFPDVKGTKVEQFYLDTLRTKQPQTFMNEYQIRDKNFVFEINAYPTKGGLSVFVKDITEQKKIEEERNKLLHDHAERIKELRCLYTISKLVEKPNISFEEILQGTVNLLPSAYQYPSIACARIIFEGQEFKTKNFKETRWKQQTDIKVHGKRVGSVGVCYLEEKPTIAEGPFLKEERDLIHTVAERLGGVAENKQAERDIRIKDNALASSINAIAIADLEGNLTYVNPSFLKLWEYDRDKEVLGKPSVKFWQLEEKAAEVLKALRDRGDWVGELTAKKKDGSIFDVYLSASMIKDNVGKPISMMGSFIDITERKHAEEALRGSEEKFRNLAEQSPNMIFINKRGRVVYTNKRCEEVMGYKREEFYSSDFNFLTLIAPEYIDLVKMNFNRHMKGEEVTPYEHALITQEGKRIEVIQASRLIKHEGESAFLGIITDITEHKKILEELRSSEKRLNILFEFAPDAYYLNDLKGNFIDGNKAAEKLTGYNKNELIGKSFLKLKLLSRRQIPKAATLLAKNAIGKPTGPDEFILSRKDGTQAQVEIRTLPVKIKDQTLVLGIAHDITERKKAEKTIRESQQKFERLFMGNPEAAVHLNTDFYILDINPRFTKLFGYSLDKIKGKHIDDLVVPKDKIEEAKMLDEKAKEGYVYHDTVRKRKDGSLVSVSISAAPITVEDTLTGYVAVYKDISQLKRTEKQLKETLEKVETMNEKLGVVGKLARHDARNKLSTVTMNTFLAKQKLASNHEVLEYLSEIESAVQQTERIFDFARIYEKLGMEELAYMDVEKSFKEAAMLFSDLRNVKVLNGCHGLTVLADSLLRQILYNLVDNSLKHGERVSRIRLHCKEISKDQLKLVYEDDGVGIPKAEKEKIFKEGYGKGTGYGLYLIKKMCEVYGWAIKETGKQGEGAQFTMTIPKMGKNGKINYKIH